MASDTLTMMRSGPRLPILFDVPEPCSESLEDVPGDKRRQYCARCKHQVHDLSALSFEEIEQLFAGENVCVSFWVRPDGSVVTADDEPIDEPRPSALRSEQRRSR